jgi:Protein of unknown function (DUF3606)
MAKYFLATASSSVDINSWSDFSPVLPCFQQYLFNLTVETGGGYWMKALGVSKDELQRAAAKVGNSAAAVRKELGARNWRVERAEPQGVGCRGAIVAEPERALTPGTG